ACARGTAARLARTLGAPPPLARTLGAPLPLARALAGALVVAPVGEHRRRGANVDDDVAKTVDRAGCARWQYDRRVGIVDDRRARDPRALPERWAVVHVGDAELAQLAPVDGSR